MDLIFIHPDVRVSEGDISYMKKKIEKLTRYNQKIHRCEVRIKEENSPEGLKTVEVQIFYPNNTTFMAKKGTTIQEAFDKAYGALKRVLTEKKQ